MRNARGGIHDVASADAGRHSRIFDANEGWLSRLLEAGRKDGSLRFDGTAAEAARAITSALEGAMLLAGPYGGPSRFESAAARMLREHAAAGRPELGATSAAGGRRAGPKTRVVARRL